MVEPINNLPELPKGWASATIPEMIPRDGVFIDGDWIESKDQDPNGDIRLIQLADIGDGVYRNKSSRFLTMKKATELDCTFLKRGDVLIARMPDPLGRACIFPGDLKEAVTAVDVCIVRTAELGVDNRWLMFATNSPTIRRAIESLQAGTTRKRISRKNLATICFPLPPANEQRRIVAKIEELFTRLDAGVEALKKVKAELKRYRQAVLKYAFEGKLTADWRKKNKDKIEPASKLLKRIAKEREKFLKRKPRQLRNIPAIVLQELPDGWEWAVIDDIRNETDEYAIVDGPFGSNLKNSDYVDGAKVPVISITNIDDGFDASKLRFITEEKFKQIKRSGVKSGDIIMAKIGSSYGKCGYYPDSMPVGMIPANMLKVTVSSSISKAFCFYYFKSLVFKKRLDSIMNSTAQPAFNVSAFKALPIPVSSFAEQQKIVAEIDRHFSIADEVEQTIERSLKEADRLRQSILKKAFEGKLVPQDPADEPAEKLLERIRAERAKLALHPQSGKRRNFKKEKT